MKPVTGVFASRSQAEQAVQKLRRAGFSEDRLALLVPGNGQKDVRSIPTSDMEQPGVGKALGGVVGGAVGLAGGLQLGAATSVFLPGIGPVLAVGILGPAILGLAGAGLGVIAGGAVENAATEGLPDDELFVYEDALRMNRSVVFAFAENEAAADSARQVIESEGAESIDAARKQWWIGLRSAEQEHYAALGKSFEEDEEFYRLGFEAGLRAARRKEYDQVLSEMATELEELRRSHPHADIEEPFRRGYERGRAYYESLRNQAE